MLRTKNTSFDVTSQQAQRTKAFNERLRYVQGFKTQLTQGDVTVNFNLNASGRELLGIAIIPVTSATALIDTQINFNVNNNNLLIAVAARNLDPNYVQNMIFFPTPQPLFGNDTLTLRFTKNDAGTVDCITNVFYVPRV